MIKFLLAVFIVVFSYTSYSQAKSSITIAGTLNYPAASKYKVGYGQSLQANIRLSEKVALSPSIEHEKIKATFTGYYAAKQSIDLFIFRVTGKYYFNKHLFADAGVLFYVGGEDGIVAGSFAPTVSIGEQIKLTKQMVLVTSLWSHFVKLYRDNLTALPGIKVGLQYNFRK